MFLHGRDVGGLYPEERAIAYVPQDYALFPHLNVEDKIGLYIPEEAVHILAG